MDDIAAAAIQEAGEEVERPGDIDVRDVDVPMLMWPEWLDEPRSLLGGSPVPVVQATCVAEHPIDAGRTDRHDVVIEHHEGQSAVAFQRMAVEIVQNGSSLPVFEPEVPRDLGVMFVDLPVALLPVVELAGTKFHPAEQAAGGNFGAFCPVADVVDDLVASIVGDPASLHPPKADPAAFFESAAGGLSSMSSAMTSFF